jgi:hypothetical protein
MDIGEEKTKRSEKMRSDYAEYCRQGVRMHAAAGLEPFSPKTYDEWAARYAGDYDWCEPD